MAHCTIAFIQATSEIGGSDIALERLVRNLDKRRFRSVVILPADGPLRASLLEAGADVRILGMMQLRSLRSPSYQFRYMLYFWPTVFRLARLLRRERASLVHTNSMYCLYGGPAAWLAGTPHVWHVREFPEVPGFALRAWTSVVIRCSDKVIAMTEAVAEIFAVRDRPQVRVIPDGIDLDAFNPSVTGARIRDELGVPPDMPLVGWVARIDPWKGLEIFIRAAAIVAAKQRARFLVCGGELAGYEEHAEAMQALAKSLGVGHVMDFTRWRYRLGDIPEVMAALDVFVHTAVRPEPFGLVIVEAMATSTPVVAARAGGVPEVVEDELSGLLIPPGDVDGYAQAISQLLNDDELRARLGGAGRVRAERYFDVRLYAQTVQALYDSVLGPAAPRGVAR